VVIVLLAREPGGEHLDYGRRYTTRTNQVQRSFEDTALKQRALELVSAA
jgi:hypothetical protein